jgi:hypothetical protein
MSSSKKHKLAKERVNEELREVEVAMRRRRQRGRGTTRKAKANLSREDNIPFALVMSM